MCWTALLTQQWILGLFQLDLPAVYSDVGGQTFYYRPDNGRIYLGHD